MTAPFARAAGGLLVVGAHKKTPRELLEPRGKEARPGWGQDLGAPNDPTSPLADRFRSRNVALRR
jgi:hypothetical protein